MRNKIFLLGSSLLAACAAIAILPSPGHTQSALKQSDTTHAILFVEVSSTDHITGVTGLTPVVKLSKNGAAGAAATGTISEVDSSNCPGLYKLVPSSGDVGTLGALHLSITASGADPVDRDVLIVAYDPFDATAAGLSTITGINTKLGTPAGASLSADIATANTTATAINTKLGAPAGASVSADIATTNTAVTSLPASVWGYTTRAINSGTVNLNLSQTLDLTQIGAVDTVGAALNGAHSGITKAVISGTPGMAGCTLVIYAGNGSTILKTYDLSTAGSKL